jgi:hypothetical protein
MPVREISERELEEIKDLYNKECSQQEICKIMKIRWTTLKRSLEILEIDTSQRRKFLKNRNCPEIKIDLPHSFILGCVYNEKYRRWEATAKCNCGNIFNVGYNALKNGETKTCGKRDCLFHKELYSPMVGTKKGYKEIYAGDWSRIIFGAKKRNIDFDISIEYAWNLFEAQNRKCVYTNKELFFNIRDNDIKTASLDRIDSSIGYIEGNVQWIHKNINKMKMNLDENTFIEWCSLISNYKKPQIIIKHIDYETRISPHLLANVNKGGLKTFTGYREIYGSRWDLTKISALNRKLDFDISIEYAWDLFEAQKRLCNLSGVELNFGKTCRDRYTASLDRIDSSIGYIEGNVQWIHKNINKMKMNFDENTFIEWATILVRHQKILAENKN